MTNDAIKLHRKLRGKIFVGSKIPNLKPKDIALIYTPGVASVCKLIASHPSEKYNLTSKGNNVAIITDGTRILGLGNIGPEAALPVMEGKAMLFKEYGNVDAFPICLSTTDKEKIIETIVAISPSFGAINLEDIESPKVLDISRALEERLSIPIFHDDRHGTAVVVLAALINALTVIKKELAEIKIVIVGAGSAGYCIGQLLNFAGCKKIVVTDSKGAIYLGRKENMNEYKEDIAKFTDSKIHGKLDKVIESADVFIGVSGKKNILKPNMIKKMNSDPIIFALTNPIPEINPITAKKAGARIVATGSYKFENKVNNAIVFPFLMRAILDLKISKITWEVLYTTALAISSSLKKNQINENNIIPEIDNKQLQKNINLHLKRLQKIA